MIGWTCPICWVAYFQASGKHLASHPSGTVERQDFRLWLAVAFADRVAVESQPDLPNWDVLAPEHPVGRALDGLLEAFPGQHVQLVDRTEDDRLAVAVVCVQHGYRAAALKRLGLSGATQRHMRDMVDNDLLPEIGSYELPPGAQAINESDEQ